MQVGKFSKINKVCCTIIRETKVIVAVIPLGWLVSRRNWMWLSKNEGVSIRFNHTQLYWSTVIYEDLWQSPIKKSKETSDLSFAKTRMYLRLQNKHLVNVHFHKDPKRILFLSNLFVIQISLCNLSTTYLRISRSWNKWNHLIL